MARDTITVDTRSGLNGVVVDLAWAYGQCATDLDAAGTLAKIAAEANSLVGMYVRGAVREGATWQQVADAIGMSRQAAHKRFSKP